MKIFFPALQPAKKLKALGVICPHAGYVYSGSLAAKTFSAVDIPETVIIIGPNHHGKGAPVSLSTRPGTCHSAMSQLNGKFVDNLLENSDIQINEIAHRLEHSLEVQVPFLQMLQKNLHIVPLDSPDSPTPFARSSKIACTTINAGNKDLLILASSDMTHYESRQSAKQKKVGPKMHRTFDHRLQHTVHSNHISMCGVIPVVVVLLAAKACCAKQSNLIGYTDSG